MKSFLGIGLAILLVLGCGSDDVETSTEDPDPSKEIIGSWELILSDGKTPIAIIQQDQEDEAEVIAATNKRVFSSNGSFFQELSVVIKYRWEDDTVFRGFWVELTFEMTVTVSGSYVISDRVIELISDNRVSIDFDASLQTVEIPELQEWGEDLQEEINESKKQIQKELEEEFREEYRLQIETFTFDLEGDRLILSNGSKDVYKKR